MAGRTRVKMCGITRLEDALHAAQFGVDALGFVFVPASSRYIELAEAAAIIAKLPAFVVPVGLFLDASEETISEALQALPSLVPQFHGRETADECERFGRPYLKALALGAPSDTADSANAQPHVPNKAAERIKGTSAYEFTRATGFLLDSHAPGALGGTGVALDWDSLNGVENVLDGRPMILAGGLGPDNVTEAIVKTRPWAVDVSSGVESSKGIKNEQAMRAFMEAVARADSQQA